PSISEDDPIWIARGMRELHRRAESLFPAATYEQLVDENGDLVDSDRLGAIIRRPYQEGTQRDGRRDINLSSRPQVFEHVIDPVLLRDLVRSVRTKCFQILCEGTEFIEKKNEALWRYELEEFRSRRSLIQLNALHRKQYGSDLKDFEDQSEVWKKLGVA